MQSETTELLLVDDAAIVHDIVMVMLSESGARINVTWKSDYASGLEALTSSAYHVCLLDYRLGERSGIDLLREARIQNSRTPVLLLTGEGSAQVDLEAMRAGASDYLVKGDFTGATLARMVRYLAERARAEDALRTSEERFALAMEGSNDGLWDWQDGTAVMHFSARWKRILGFEPHELSDALETWMSRVHEDDAPRLRREFGAYTTTSDRPHFESEHRLRHRDGTWRHVLVRGKAVRSKDGRARRIAGSCTDVTMARSRDPLTGLANRVLFLDRLEHAVERTTRESDYRFAVLFIDLDRFKNINDSLGHEAGDALLVAIAQRLESCSRGIDTVARLGGDEFVMLLDGTREPDGALRVGSRIVEELARPFHFAGHELFSGASIGIALSGPDYLRGGELLRDADTAMYRAKAAGRGRCMVFDDAMHVRALQILSIESELRHALVSAQLEVYYQPVVDLVSGRPLGFEALARWRHPDRGFISPADFIPVAEDSGLIVSLDGYVLERATQQLKQWRQRFGQDLTISVNASRKHFSQGDLVARVKSALSQSGLPAQALHIEVTETATMDVPSTARAQFDALHALGVRLYVDDFGVGYSSLSMLHTYPFRGLKLDRSFVSRLGKEMSSTEVVKAVIAIANALRLDIVAEGVETDSQRANLIELGCARGQGYFFEKPLPAARAEWWLETKFLQRQTEYAFKNACDPAI